jgi:hypothetical protein
MKEESSKPLPNWFKVHKPSDEKKVIHTALTSSRSNFPDVRSEELLKLEEDLRSDAFMYCSNLLDNLLEASTKSVHEETLQNSMSFVCATSSRHDAEIEPVPSKNQSKNPASISVNNDNDSQKKRERSVEEWSQEENGMEAAKRHKVSPPYSHHTSINPHILPCSILHTNSTAILDRSYLVQHLIKQKFSSKNSAVKVCLLSRQHSLEVSSPFVSHSKETVSKTASLSSVTLADLLKRVAFELLSVDFKKNNHPETESCYRWLIKRIKTATIRECMELIIHWDHHSSNFDSVVLVLEVSS